MRAKELAELLMQHPDRVVVLSRDPEGNGFSPVRDANTGAYVVEESDVMLELADLTKDMLRMGYTEEDVAPEGYLPAIVLWPSG